MNDKSTNKFTQTSSSITQKIVKDIRL